MPRSRAALPAAPDRLLTWTFVVVVGSASAYFTAMGTLFPVLPRYVIDEFNGNGVQVGLVVGAFAVSAGLIRPTVGRLGDRLGRRPLVVAGAVVAGLSIAAYGVMPLLPVLVLLRLVTGIGEAAYFVGAATAAQDLSPPGRHAEAASYFSIAIYGGMAIGPFVGEVLYRSGGPGRVWLVAAVLAGLSALSALLIPGSLGRRPVVPEGAEAESLVGTGSRRFLHPAAALPGTILLLGTIGLAAVTSFLALHLEDLGIADAGPYFLIYGVAVLAIRILGARVPGRLGVVRTSTIALAAIIGSTLLIAVATGPEFVVAGVVLFALGMALVYPALFGLAVERAPEAERSHAVGTFTLYVDLGQGLGAPVLGLFVTLTGTHRAAFVVGAVVAAAALVLARTRLPEHHGAGGSPVEPGGLTFSD